MLHPSTHRGSLRATATSLDRDALEEALNLVELCPGRVQIISSTTVPLAGSPGRAGMVEVARISLLL